MDVETRALWTTTREAMGKTWQVQLWPDDAGLTDGKPKSECLGKNWWAQQWVRVAAARPMDGRDATILHELIHLANISAGTYLKENQVFALTENLFAFLRGFGLWQDFPWPDREENA